MVKLADITWTKVHEYLINNDTAILPIGSIEQHGPHSPLGTDFYIAESVSNIIGEKTDCLVLPIIPVSVSEHHRQFTGTLWVTPDIFRQYIKSILLSASSHGLKKIIIINGHGGNTPSLLEISEELRRQHGVFVAVITAFPPKLDGHAGKDETSIMLHLKPNLIIKEKIVDTLQHKNLGTLPLTKAQRMDPAQFGWDTIDFSDTGVFGGAGKLIKPSESTEKRGKEIFENHLKDIIQFIELIKTINVSELLSKDHK